MTTATGGGQSARPATISRTHDPVRMNRWCVIKGKGGMGNRMLCAATGLLWSKVARRTPFVDWRDGDYAPVGENAFQRFFAAEGVSYDAPPAGLDVQPPCWSGQLDRSMSSMLDEFHPDKHSSLRIHRHYSIDPSRSDQPATVAVLWYYTGRFGAISGAVRQAIPSLAHATEEGIARYALRHELIPRPAISQRVEDFQNHHWADAVIGVHVRHTDRSTRVSTMESATARMLKRLPSAAIFLATDNVEVERRFARRFGPVLTTPKWFPPPGSTMHQNALCSDLTENGMEALVDMHLLGRCDALVYASRSTFSEVSRLLSDLPSDRVIDIDRYNPVIRAKRLVRWIAE